VIEVRWKPLGWRNKRPDDSWRHSEAARGRKTGRFSFFKKPKYPKNAPTKEVFSALSKADDHKIESLEDLKGVDLKRDRPSLGKFEGNYNATFARLLNEASIDGTLDGELGDVETMGWYGYMDLSDLNIKEKGVPVAGVIINEDSNGFFGYTSYPSMEKLRKEWDSLEKEEDDMQEDESAME
jgi:hypothetical protein